MALTRRAGRSTRLLVVSLVMAVRVGVPRSWVAAGAFIVLAPLATGTFTSEGRFGLLALPVYWGLSALGRRASLDRSIRAVSSALLAAGVFTIVLHFP